jgi:hypothetical protein
MSRSITRFCVSGIEKNSEEIEKLKKIICLLEEFTSSPYGHFLPIFLRKHPVALRGAVLAIYREGGK